MSKLLIFLTLIPLLPFLCNSFSSCSMASPSNPLTHCTSSLCNLGDSIWNLSSLMNQRSLCIDMANIYMMGTNDLAAIVNFVDSGHDLILAADTTASNLIREVASECGVDFDEDPAAMVIDHAGYAVSVVEGDHTLIASDDFIKSDVILGSNQIEAPVLFQGIGHSLNPSNSMVLKALSASGSAYSANPKSKLTTPLSLTGSAISLVSIVQARNNARILISGSLNMFSNQYANFSGPGCKRLGALQSRQQHSYLILVEQVLMSHFDGELLVLLV